MRCDVVVLLKSIDKGRKRVHGIYVVHSLIKKAGQRVVESVPNPNQRGRAGARTCACDCAGGGGRWDPLVHTDAILCVCLSKRGRQQM
jgi:hypothetical protein